MEKKREIHVAISAGHHEGARGAGANNFFEYPETMKWATILMTIINDRYPEIRAHLVPAESLTEKVRFINALHDQYKLSFALEVHFNSSPGGGASGSESLFCPGTKKGVRAANIIQNAIGELMAPNRGTKEGWYKMDRPGIVDYDGDMDGDEHPDYFLKATKCPAVVVEPEFIQHQGAINTNRDECCSLMADAIARIVREA